MKKWILVCTSFFLALMVSACGKTPDFLQAERESVPETQNYLLASAQSADRKQTASVMEKDTSEATEENENMNRKIQIETESGTVLVFELNDSSAATSLYEQLPLTVDVGDFSTNEKIFYPPEQLDLTDTPNAEMEVGTLAYYAPWGNVVMFYDVYSPNGDLYALGHTTSQEQDIEMLSGKIKIEKAL